MLEAISKLKMSSAEGILAQSKAELKGNPRSGLPLSDHAAPRQN
jgi:hypothetical protein